MKHKHLPPQIDFAALQDSTLKPVHYLIKHEEALPHQKSDSHPILANYGTDQFSIRINDKENDVIVKPLTSFSFKCVTSFQTKFKAPIKKNNKSLNIKTPLSTTTPHESATAINIQPHSHPTTHCSQIKPFHDTSFFNYKNYFKGFFLPDVCSLDLKTLKQQSQDPVLRIVYSWLNRNEKPEFLTPLITGTPFLYAYYKRFSQLFIED